MALSGGGKAYIGLIFLLIASLLMLAAHGTIHPQNHRLAFPRV